MGSAAPYYPDFAWEISELSTLCGKYSSVIQITADFGWSREHAVKPLLFIIQKPLTRFWQKASLAQGWAQGQLENIPEPFNNPWLVFKLKTKAQVGESLQMFRLCKKISEHLVINSHHLFSCWENLPVSISFSCLTEHNSGLYKKGLSESWRERYRMCRELFGKQTARLALVWMPCSLLELSSGAPLSSKSSKFTVLSGARYPSQVHCYILSSRITEFYEILHSFRCSAIWQNSYSATREHFVTQRIVKCCTSLCVGNVEQKCRHCSHK